MEDLFDRGTLRNAIILRLTIMQECLKWHSMRGESDACKTAEDVVARFLAVLCGWKLVNLNTIKKNYPAADLGDHEQRLAIQVTVDGTPDKVRKTHAKATTHKLGDDFDRLIILFLLPDAPSDPRPSSTFIPCASPTIEKWARPQLDTLIDACSTEKLRELLAVLENEMSGITTILAPSLVQRPTIFPNTCLGTLRKRIEDYRDRMVRDFDVHPTGSWFCEGLGSDNIIQPRFILQGCEIVDKEVEVATPHQLPRSFTLETISSLAVLPQNLWLSGPSGAGKSTALRMLIRELAIGGVVANDRTSRLTLPLFLTNLEEHLDFLQTVTTALSFHLGLQTGWSIGDLDGCAQTVLICDGIDEIPGASRLARKIADFAHSHPRIRVIVSSRSSELSFPAIFRQVALDSLTNRQIHSILASSSSAEDASLTVARLESLKAIEAFRSPLMTWLLAACGSDLSSIDANGSIVRIYETAMQALLTRGQEAQGETRQDATAASKLIMQELARCGYLMASSNSMELDLHTANKYSSQFSNHVRFGRSDMPIDPFELSMQVGILKRTFGGFQFTHLTIRDFFAALRIAALPRWRRPYGILFRKQWQHVTPFVIGLVDQKEADVLLLQLVRTVGSCCQLAGFGISLGTRRLFILLSALAGCGRWADQHRTATIAAIRKVGPGHLYLLNERGSRVESKTGRNQVGCYEEFFSLVGVFGSTISADLLMDFMGYYRECVVHGVQKLEEPFRTKIMIRFLLGDSAELKNTSVKDLTAYFFVRDIDEMRMRMINEVFATGSNTDLLRMLVGIDCGLRSLNEEKDIEDSAILKQFIGERFGGVLADLVIHHHDDVVREEAQHVARKLGKADQLIESVEHSCVEAISGPDPCYKAIWPLVYGSFPESEVALERLVRGNIESDIYLALKGMEVMRHRNRESFEILLIELLRRYSELWVDQVINLCTQNHQNLDGSDTSEIDQTFLQLLYGSHCGIGVLRWWSWRTIFRRYPSADLECLVVRRYLEDEDGDVRCEMLDWLIEHKIEPIDEFVNSGLGDSSEVVVKCAIDYYCDKVTTVPETAVLDVIVRLANAEGFKYLISHQACHFLGKVGLLHLIQNSGMRAFASRYARNNAEPEN